MMLIDAHRGIGDGDTHLTLLRVVWRVELLHTSSENRQVVGGVNLAFVITWGKSRNPNGPHVPPQSCLPYCPAKKNRIILGSAPTRRLRNPQHQSKDFTISFANPRPITRNPPASSAQDSRWVTRTERERAPAYVQVRIRRHDRVLIGFLVCLQQSVPPEGHDRPEHLPPTIPVRASTKSPHGRTKLTHLQRWRHR